MPYHHMKRKFIAAFPVILGITIGTIYSIFNKRIGSFTADPFLQGFYFSLGVFSALILFGLGLVSLINFIIWRCPSCRGALGNSHKVRYCRFCGGQII
jgi:hypothetical protein